MLEIHGKHHASKHHLADALKDLLYGQNLAPIKIPAIYHHGIGGTGKGTHLLFFLVTGLLSFFLLITGIALKCILSILLIGLHGTYDLVNGLFDLFIRGIHIL